jgi:maleamate amidohydrolase
MAEPPPGEQEEAPLRAGDWRSVIGERDRTIYEAAGYGARGIPGRRPMMLVIDVTYGFVGREREPILESIKRYPNSCGEAGWDAVEAIARILQPVRALGRPVVYSTGFTELGTRGQGLWSQKHPRAVREVPPDSNMIPEEITPGPNDIVLPKTKPSLFHGTPLVDLLIRERTDTLIVTGGTTSGCVRATVIDAFSHNIPVLVVEDGVFDRGELSHAVNLFDMDQKYANVTSSQAVLDYVSDLTEAGGSPGERRAEAG